jgi:hypothetical protein
LSLGETLLWKVRLYGSPKTTPLSLLVDPKDAAAAAASDKAVVLDAALIGPPRAGDDGSHVAAVVAPPGAWLLDFTSVGYCDTLLWYREFAALTRFLRERCLLDVDPDKEAGSGAFATAAAAGASDASDASGRSLDRPRWPGAATTASATAAAVATASTTPKTASAGLPRRNQWTYASDELEII